jgi:hypothetical protein
MDAAANIMEGMGERQAAQAEAQAARNNSYRARTRAAQADTDARTGLESELGNMRATLGANAQGANVGTFEMFRELREVRNRERRVDVGNRNQEARDFNTAANNASNRAKWAMPVAIAKSAQSLFDFAQGGM